MQEIIGILYSRRAWENGHFIDGRHTREKLKDNLLRRLVPWERLGYTLTTAFATQAALPSSVFPARTTADLHMKRDVVDNYVALKTLHPGRCSLSSAPPTVPTLQGSQRRVCGRTHALLTPGHTDASLIAIHLSPSENLNITAVFLAVLHTILDGDSQREPVGVPQIVVVASTSYLHRLQAVAHWLDAYNTTIGGCSCAQIVNLVRFIYVQRSHYTATKRPLVADGARLHVPAVSLDVSGDPELALANVIVLLLLYTNPTLTAHDRHEIESYLRRIGQPVEQGQYRVIHMPTQRYADFREWLQALDIGTMCQELEAKYNGRLRTARAHP